MFVLFRIFDIAKPYPINYYDKKKNSFGVIMDDVVQVYMLWLYLFYMVINS